MADPFTRQMITILEVRVPISRGLLTLMLLRISKLLDVLDSILSPSHEIEADKIVAM